MDTTYINRKYNTNNTPNPEYIIVTQTISLAVHILI